MTDPLRELLREALDILKGRTYGHLWGLWIQKVNVALAQQPEPVVEHDDGAAFACGGTERFCLASPSAAALIAQQPEPVTQVLPGEGAPYIPRYSLPVGTKLYLAPPGALIAENEARIDYLERTHIEPEAWKAFEHSLQIAQERAEAAGREVERLRTRMSSAGEELADALERIEAAEAEIEHWHHLAESHREAPNDKPVLWKDRALEAERALAQIKEEKPVASALEWPICPTCGKPCETFTKTGCVGAAQFHYAQTFIWAGGKTYHLGCEPHESAAPQPPAGKIDLPQDIHFRCPSCETEMDFEVTKYADAIPREIHERLLDRLSTFEEQHKLACLYMDEWERAGGDAPHRAVRLVDRLKVQHEGVNRLVREAIEQSALICDKIAEMREQGAGLISGPGSRLRQAARMIRERSEHGSDPSHPTGSKLKG
jgi:hypothetical protein